MSDTRLIVAALVAAVIAIVITRVIETLARRRSLLDIPNERSSHVVPTPRLGGVGIVAGTIAGWLIGGGAADPQIVAIVGVGLALAAVGLVDDLTRISVAIKYSAQLVAATAAALVADPSLRLEVAGASLVLEGWPAIVATAVWLTALINAFNFMDGIDGMTGGVAAVTAIVGIGLATAGADLALVALAAACIGFLVWNQQPASIFMGDVGSQFLGYLVGVCLVLQPRGEVGLLPVVICVAPFLIDTGVTLVRRAAAGRNVFAGHREHLYQRLTMAGFSHRAVSAGYAIAAAVAGIAALTWSSTAVGQLGTVILIGFVALAYVRWVAMVESRAAREQPAA